MSHFGTESPGNDCDVLVIGGGPAGATAALILARKGRRVTIIEKSAFPRFQIGESFLPATYAQLGRLGLLDKLKALPHMRKIGAAFGMGSDDRLSVFRFSTELAGDVDETFNIARADFDVMMLDAAREAGARVMQPAAVKSIDRLSDDDVSVILADGRRLKARQLIDASGHQSIVGRHLGTRRMLSDPHLRKVAYFQHFTGVRRLEGEYEGLPIIIICQEGWFWLIPLNDKVTSVGMVLEPETARASGVAADRMLEWGIARCPLLASHMSDTVGPQTNLVRADFSYRCDPFAGPGHVLIGDAAMFMDPVFSTGVCAGMMAAEHAAEALEEMISGRLSPAKARHRYLAYMHPMMGWFTRMVEMFYAHDFREMLLHGTGPMKVHRAVLSLLAGHIAPHPPFAVRWRIRLFECLRRIHRRVALVPGRKPFSILSAKPAGAGRTDDHAHGQPDSGARGASA